MTRIHFVLLATALVLDTNLFVSGRPGKNPYSPYVLDVVCPFNNAKRELSMGTGAAIFYLDEESNNATRQLLSKRDFKCHLELEAPDRHWGLHAFIEEMSLDNEVEAIKGLSSSSSTGSIPCKDYLQYGRDQLAFTTKMSPKWSKMTRTCAGSERRSFPNSNLWNSAKRCAS